MTKFKEMLKKWRETFKKMLAAVKCKGLKAIAAVKKFFTKILKAIFSKFKKNKTEEEKPETEKKPLRERIARRYLHAIDTVKAKLAVPFKKVKECFRCYSCVFRTAAHAAVAVVAFTSKSVAALVLALLSNIGLDYLFDKAEVAVASEEAPMEIDDKEFAKAIRDEEYKNAWSEFEACGEAKPSDYAKYPKFMNFIDEHPWFYTGCVIGVSVLTGCALKFGFGIDSGSAVTIGCAVGCFVNYALQFVYAFMASNAIKRFNKKVNDLRDKLVNGVKDACARVDEAASARLKARAEELKAAKKGNKGKKVMA